MQALDTDEDLLSAMARELVEKAGIGETADAVWRELGSERNRVLPQPNEQEQESDGELVTVLKSGGHLPSEAAPTTFGIPLLRPGPGSKRRRKTPFWPTAKETNPQLSLFD